MNNLKYEAITLHTPRFLSQAATDPQYPNKGPGIPPIT
jgi:hypothetical protein